MPMYVLVINAGSSSLKYQIIDSETEELVTRGLCEKVGYSRCLRAALEQERQARFRRADGEPSRRRQDGARRARQGP